MDKMPLADDYAGMVICQEGIEHFSDQLKALKEFNRILKLGGRLIITTPSSFTSYGKIALYAFRE